MTNTPDSRSEGEKREPDAALVGWVMDRVSRWRSVRDSSYASQWEKYYAIWRGKWTTDLQNKSVERSRIIAPATQQAIDQTVAEMAEAVFGRGDWFDITDDADPQHQQLAELEKDTLLDDFAKDKIKAKVIETFQLGAIYGTGIAKRVIDEKKAPKFLSDKNGDPYASDDRRICVSWEAIPPYNFVIDSAATSIEDALGCAHETVRPIHEITDLQRTGEYKKGDVASASGYGSSNVLRGSLGDVYEVDPIDGVYITEYHGLVPKELLEGKEAEDSDADLREDAAEDETDGVDDEIVEYVEAIITIGNGMTLLKAEENPILGGDRGVIAYQHHKSPNRFWGIGQAEKAYNSQVGLDAEIRARIDALGLITYPVIGADATRLPKNLNLKVSPGKVIMTQGKPSDVIEAIKFGNLDPISFQHSGDLERMVQMATGAADPATPINTNGMNGTSSGMSMAQGAVIKRAKLTMQNVDSDFLDPLVRKSLLAYMTLDPDRYPVDVKFRVNSTMSIMAREFEQMQMTNLLAIIPQESPAFPIVLTAIVENYSGPSKDKILQAIEQIGKPDPQKQQADQQQQQMQMQMMQAQLGKIQAEIAEVQSRASLNGVKGQAEMMKAHHEGQQLDFQASDQVLKNKSIEVQSRALDIQQQKLHQDNVNHSLNHAHDVNTTMPVDKAYELETAKLRMAAQKQAFTSARASATE